MKTAAEDIAKAAVDAAFAELEQAGLVHEKRRLAQFLIEAVREREGIVEVTLITPSGDAGPLKGEIVSLLEAKLDRRVLLREKADPAMIGGVRILVGDVQVDRSLRRELDELALTLSQSPLSV